MFRQIIVAAFIGGALAGLVAFGVQQMWATPLILAAETFEQPNAAVQVHDAGAAAQGHAPEEWAPADGAERTLYSAGMSVLTGIGFALVLVALFSLRQEGMTWRRGLVWGAAAFFAVALAPALSLPPELPGQPAAPLLWRQAWWLGTVVVSGAGLGLVLLSSPWLLRVGGLVLIALPHLIGAPHTAELVPEGVAALLPQFAAATLLANAAFWLVLGSVSGHLYGRLTDGTPSA